jgi:hypothetical protein
VFIDVKADTILGTPDVIFTDGNAAQEGTKFYLGLNHLDELDWESITCPGDYASIGGLTYDREWQRKRSSEVLVPGGIPNRLFSRIVVFDENARTSLISKISEFEGEVREKIRTPIIICQTDCEEIYYY